MTAEHFKKIIESIGEDIGRPGLIDTPKRASKAFSFFK
jgi:GTP cyclohydrolase I